MKLKELESILCDPHRHLQLVVIYDSSSGKDLRYGCSIEYAIKDYGEHIVKRISSWFAEEEHRDYLVIDI
jgi:hypothetical protein